MTIKSSSHSPWHITVLTLFPEIFPGPLGTSLPGKALEKGTWQLDVMNIRDFADNKHQSVDDTPCGGGAGMVMRADIVAKAIDHALAQNPNRELIYLTPKGDVITQALCAELAEDQDKKEGLILLCGRYEGVDQRILDHYNPREISLGDFVLAGGEVAALALIEACLRLRPSVIGKEESVSNDSFQNGLLEHPHYTRPQSWQGRDVPEVLLSGHHAAIDAWRQSEAEKITQKRRPDLWQAYASKQDAKILPMKNRS